MAFVIGLTAKATTRPPPSFPHRSHRRVVASCLPGRHQDRVDADQCCPEAATAFREPGAGLRRRLLLSCVAAAAAPATLGRTDAEAADFQCRGLRSRELQLCLREKRLKQEEEEGASDRDDEFLKNRQYEQPGTLVVTEQGVQYRDIDEGNPQGRQCSPGQVCEISYTVYRLASGAYFKYSSGGTPVYLWSVGYGNEGKDDTGSVYRFTLGEKDSVPPTVAVALNGMREGGRRRVLVPPSLGWRDSKTMGPRPDTFGASRRLEAHKDEALLFEAELRRVVPQGSTDGNSGRARQGGGLKGLKPYSLPAPPTLDSGSRKSP